MPPERAFRFERTCPCRKVCSFYIHAKPRVLVFSKIIQQASQSSIVVPDTRVQIIVVTAAVLDPHQELKQPRGLPGTQQGAGCWIEKEPRRQSHAVEYCIIIGGIAADQSL